MLVLLMLSCAACTGCSTTRYLAQAGRGQLEFFNRARPLGEVIADEKTPGRVRTLLAEVPAIKAFGESRGLKATKNYQDYVSLDRPASVWVVSAAEELEFKSVEWRFPIVGAFPYLGWFSLEGARDFAAELRAQGKDVDMRGARAFSTLGWFKDPIVSTMIPEGDEAFGDLVNVVLHESVHATYYLNGQAYLNESVADFVADLLTEEYLRAKGRKDELRAWRDGDVAYEERSKLMHAAYEKLRAVYARSGSDDEKRAEKKRVLAELSSAVAARQGGAKPREINNATLIQFKTYDTGKAEFARLYAACGKDLSRFWGALRRLTAESFARSQQEDIGGVVARLAGEGC